MDDFVVNILNTLAHNSNFLTRVMFTIASNSLIKGGVIVTCLYYLWFNDKNEIPNRREKIIILLYATIIAIAVGRGFANLLPYRARPILQPEFNFTYQIDEFSWLNTWSSFPSDHAILFFSLATGIFLVSKRWGIFSYLYVLFVICLPRIYLGFHYLTDILAGAIIGISIMLVISVLKPFWKLSKKTVILSTKYPGIFYASFFILCFQISTLFNESRALIGAIFNYIFS